MPVLADTSFRAGPDQKLATADIYSQSGLGNITDVVSKLGSAIHDSAALALIRSSVSTVNNFQKNALAGFAQGKAMLSPDNILSSLMHLNSPLLSAIRNLNSEIQGVIKLTDEVKNSIALTINGYHNIIQGFDVSTVTGLVGMLTALFDDVDIPVEFRDTLAITQLCINLITQASSIGLKGIFTALMGSETFRTTAKDRAIYSVSRSLIGQPDNALLKEITDLGLGREIRIQNPNFVYQYLCNYKAQSGSLSEQQRTRGLAQEWDDLSASLTAVDAEWLMKMRNMNYIYRAPLFIDDVAPLRTLLMAHVNFNLPDIAGMFESNRNNLRTLNLASSVPSSAILLAALDVQKRNVLDTEQIIQRQISGIVAARSRNVALI